MKTLPRRWLLLGVALVLMSVALGFVSISCGFDRSGVAPTTGIKGLPAPDACQGEPYEHGIYVLGGQTPYTWTILDDDGNPDPSKLPPGLKLQYASGAGSYEAVLVGTPTTLGTFSFQIEVKDSTPPPSQTNFVKPVKLRVSDFLITLADLPNFCPGDPYDVEITTCGGISPLQWALKGNWPSGLTLTKGHLQGTPTDTGEFKLIVSVQDSSSPPKKDDKEFTIYSVDELTIMSPWPYPYTLPHGASGKPYGPLQFQACGGQPPYAWDEPGKKLPPWGLGLSPLGKLDGTPKVPGNHQFRLRVEDSSTPSKQSAERNFLLPVVAGPVVLTSTSPLPDATECTNYPKYTFIASGGSGSYQWKSGPLPYDLQLNSGGVLDGKPSLPTPNPATLQITVADATDATKTASKPFSLNVLENPIATPELEITELRHTSGDPYFYDKFNLAQPSQNVRVDYRFPTQPSYLNYPMPKALLQLVGGQCTQVSDKSISPSPIVIGGQNVRVARFSGSLVKALFDAAGKQAGDAVRLRFSVDVTVDNKTETFVNILEAQLYDEQ